MALYLVQHGKSLPKNLDPDQGLSEEGIAEVERIAKVAKGYGVQVSCIKHSVKKRARQTAEIMASALEPAGGIVETVGLKPMDDVTAFAGTLDSKDDIMLSGHLPFMEKMASYLITGATDKPVIKFQNGGIVCLHNYTEIGGWAIKWTLMPKID
jgi:phosphohistidine phosphatase